MAEALFPGKACILSLGYFLGYVHWVNVGGPSAVGLNGYGLVYRAGVSKLCPSLSTTLYIMTSDTDNEAASRSQSPEESGDQETGDMAEHPDFAGKTAPQSKPGNGQAKTASNAKDPLRPRRKKARRACYACQRAHLTCGKHTKLDIRSLFNSRLFPSY